jgi:hypothetical protein
VGVFFGVGPSYLDTSPRFVAGVTTDDTNAALRRHIDLGRLTIVVAGEVGS